MTRRGLLGVTGLGLTLAACGGSPPPAAPPPPPRPVAAAPTVAATPAAPAPAPAPAAATPAPTALVPPAPALPAATGPSYETKGRRDPFAPLEVIGGPTGLTVATTKLTGIVRSARSTLALLETSDGIGYILKPGDTLGDGRLVEIGVDNVVFALAARPGSLTNNRVVLKLASN